MRRHHRNTRANGVCSVNALTAEENEILLDRFLESVRSKIDEDELSRRQLPHGVLSAQSDGSNPSVYGPFNNSHDAAEFARQLELRLSPIENDVHFLVIPLDLSLIHI